MRLLLGATRKVVKTKKLQTEEEEKYKKDNQVLALQVEALQVRETYWKLFCNDLLNIDERNIGVK